MRYAIVSFLITDKDCHEHSNQHIVINVPRIQSIIFGVFFCDKFVAAINKAFVVKKMPVRVLNKSSSRDIRARNCSVVGVCRAINLKDERIRFFCVAAFIKVVFDASFI